MMTFFRLKRRPSALFLCVMVLCVWVPFYVLIEVSKITVFRTTDCMEDSSIDGCQTNRTVDVTHLRQTMTEENKPLSSSIPEALFHRISYGTIPGYLPIQNQYINITGKVIKEKTLVIGIPTIVRPKSGISYVNHTLRSLVRHISPAERKDVVILLYTADFEQAKREKVVKFVKNAYQSHLDSGFILIVEIDEAAYPPLEGLKRNYNDSAKRVKWRSKQVVDFAFMFWIGKDLAKYYLQIEDDVLSSMSLFQKVMNGVKNNLYKKWVTLEYSSLGFIGKLYKSADLNLFAKFLLLFYSEQPVDWLYQYFNRLLTQDKRILIKPPLFQHFGLRSSLQDSTKASLNKLREPSYAEPDPMDLAEVEIAPLKAHKKDTKTVEKSPNPPAKIKTSMLIYSEYIPLRAYLGNPHLFCWTKIPRVNDTFTIIFNDVLNQLHSLQILSGNEKHLDDVIRSGVVEWSSQGNDNGCQNYTTLTNFVDGKAVMANITGIHDVKCLRIRITDKQMDWVIIRNILINKSGGS